MLDTLLFLLSERTDETLSLLIAFSVILFFVITAAWSVLREVRKTPRTGRRGDTPPLDRADPTNKDRQ